MNAQVLVYLELFVRYCMYFAPRDILVVQWYHCQSSVHLGLFYVLVLLRSVQLFDWSFHHGVERVTGVKVGRCDPCKRQLSCGPYWVSRGTWPVDVHNTKASV